MLCRNIVFALAVIGITYVIPATTIHAASSGPNSPGTASDVATAGTVAWTNPQNAKVSDDTYVSADLTGTASLTSHYLSLSNFGFSVPTGATINGISVEIDKKGQAVDALVKIIKKDGSLGTVNKGKEGTWPASETTFTYGGASDLWSETWTPEDINDPDFGVTLVAYVIRYAAPCLHANSLITTDMGNKEIMNILPGDLILTYNEHDKLFEYKRVTDVWSWPIAEAQNTYVRIYYDGDKNILATKNHLFFIDGLYKEADTLQVGDRLFSSDGSYYPIQRIELISNTDDQVWDLTVEDNHNFFVNDILVHNNIAFAYVDHVRITVYYTEVIPTPTPTPTPTTTTPGTSAPDPNNHVDDWHYVKQITAGPNFIGIPVLIGNPSTAQTLITNTTHHDDVNISVQTPPIESLAVNNIPFPWAQGLNTAGEITKFTTVAAFNGYPVGSFDNPAIVQLSFDPTRLGGHDPTELRIAYYDPETHSWVVLSDNTVLDLTQHKLANTTKYVNTYFTVVYPSGASTGTQSVQGVQSEILPISGPVSPTPAEPPTIQPVIPESPLSRLLSFTRAVISMIVSPFVKK